MRRRLAAVAQRGAGALLAAVGLLVVVLAVGLPLALSAAGLGRDGVVIGLLVAVVVLLAAVLLSTLAAWRATQVVARRVRALEAGTRPAPAPAPRAADPSDRAALDDLARQVADVREAMWALVPDLRTELRLYHADLATAGGRPAGEEAGTDPVAQHLEGRPAQTVLVLDDAVAAARLAARSAADGRTDVVVLAPAAAVAAAGLPDLGDVSLVLAPGYPHGSVGEGAVAALRAQLDADVPVVTVP